MPWATGGPKPFMKGTVLRGNTLIRPRPRPKSKPSRRSGAGNMAAPQRFFGRRSPRLPTKRAKIDWKYGEYIAAFKVEGVGEVQSDYILNPVTGEKFTGEIVLPNGISWKRSAVTRIKKLALHDADLQFDHKDTAGFTTTVKSTEKGHA